MENKNKYIVVMNDGKEFGIFDNKDRAEQRRNYLNEHCSEGCIFEVKEVKPNNNEEYEGKEL